GGRDRRRRRGRLDRRDVALRGRRRRVGRDRGEAAAAVAAAGAARGRGRRLQRRRGRRRRGGGGGNRGRRRSRRGRGRRRRPLLAALLVPVLDRRLDGLAEVGEVGVERVADRLQRPLERLARVLAVVDL